MGRLDRSSGQDAVMERRHIEAMLRNVDDYEAIKNRSHERYKTAKSFYLEKGLCKQNFLKFYRRYVLSNRCVEALIPRKVGRRYSDSINYTPNVIETLKEVRSKGYNRFDISMILKLKEAIEISPSSVYRLTKKLGLNRLDTRIKVEKRKIVKMACGELGHVDIHYVAKGTVREVGNKKLYIVGIIDDYSRVCWLEVIDSIKAIDVMFASLDILLRLKERYDISFKEMLSDNGSEFASKNNPLHPFEKMLEFYGIKHRYTKPCRPQTNGKIERFWRTLEEELLSGETFETLDEFRDYIMGYVLYYNEHRMHQGIDHETPESMTKRGN